MLYVISGCSGGGKSSLVDALASRGFCISEEPGRQIVCEELDTGGDALPWMNPVAFSEKCAELSVHRFTAATKAGTDVFFFDRLLMPFQHWFMKSQIVLRHICKGFSSFVTRVQYSSRPLGPKYLRTILKGSIALKMLWLNTIVS